MSGGQSSGWPSRHVATHLAISATYMLATVVGTSGFSANGGTSGAGGVSGFSTFTSLHAAQV